MLGFETYICELFSGALIVSSREVSTEVMEAIISIEKQKRLILNLN